jgi:hypothetical protein
MERSGKGDQELPWFFEAGGKYLTPFVVLFKILCKFAKQLFTNLKSQV